MQKHSYEPLTYGLHNMTVQELVKLLEESVPEAEVWVIFDGNFTDQASDTLSYGFSGDTPIVSISTKY